MRHHETGFRVPHHHTTKPQITTAWTGYFKCILWFPDSKQQILVWLFLILSLISTIIWICCLTLKRCLPSPLQRLSSICLVNISILKTS